MPQGTRRTESPSERRPYPSEALLIDIAAEITGPSIVCTSPGLAQLGGAIAERIPAATVDCFFLDLYRANLAAEYWQDRPANLRITCAADITVPEVDSVAFPFSANGEAELTRDLIQAGHQRLKMGGRMFAAIDNRRDTWLQEQLQRVFRRVERRAHRTGVVYVGTKTDTLKKVKNYSCEFAFRDRGRLIRTFSLPGVFSHRRIDPGARHLLDEMEIHEGMRVLDLGCGTGVVALAAACRSDRVHAHAVDSNARAILCAERGATLNGLTNVTTELSSTADVRDAGQYDLVLANPPYYANFRIARHFLDVGRTALRDGGKILVVTKLPEWYYENMTQWYGDVSVRERKGYYVFTGRHSNVPSPSSHSRQ